MMKLDSGRWQYLKLVPAAPVTMKTFLKVLYYLILLAALIFLMGIEFFI
jgi:hypothetical protein